MARIEINGLTITGDGSVTLIGNTIGGEVTIDGDEITVDGERIDGDRVGQVIITGRRQDKKDR